MTRLRRGSPLVDLARLLGLGATVLFLWAGLLEAILLAMPLVAREMLLVVAGASLHVLLLFVAESRGPGTSRAQRVACKAWLAATGVLLSCCLVEWVFPWRLPAWVYDVVPDDPRIGAMLVDHPTRGKTLRPGFRGRYVHPEFPGVRVEINELGMRDRPDEGAP